MLRLAGRSSLIVLVAALLVTTLSADSIRRSRSKPFAYVTDQEVVVIRDGSVVARRKIQYDRRLGTLTSTLDGRYFLLFDGSVDPEQTDPQTRALVALDSTTGKEHLIPCIDCQGIFPVGDSRILYKKPLSDTDAIFKLDISSDDPPTRFSMTDVPRDLTFRATTRDAVLSMVVDTKLLEENYFLLNARGQSRQLAKTRGWKTNSETGVTLRRIIGIAAGTRTKDGVTRFAVSNGVISRGGACEIEGTVTLFSDDQKAGIDTDMSPIVNATSRGGAELFAVDLWWEDGALHGIFGQGACVVSVNTPVFPEYSEWRLQDMRWERSSVENAPFRRHLDPYTTVHASPPGKLMSSQQLWLTRDNDARLIAKDFADISVSPV